MSTIPNDEMVTRIAEMFQATWQTIAYDIRESWQQMAKFGDKEAKAMLKRGVLTPQELYETAYDFIGAYGDDDEAFEAFEAWNESGGKEMKKVLLGHPKMKGAGF
jgi:hypothetical protein